MNNHQNTTSHQFENCLSPPLALLVVDLNNSKINKICHFVNHPYLCRGLVYNIPSQCKQCKYIVEFKESGNIITIYNKNTIKKL